MNFRSKLIYGLTIFFSAFLLFQAEPLIAKIILPWFGGVAAVWTVSLLFFQFTLFLGYLYAHLLTRNFSAKKQGQIHATVLALGFLALPILPKDHWKLSLAAHPALHVLLLLTSAIGLPYFLLSSTSPLLQTWYASKHAGASPYRFYALSNAGSMLALISYPVLVEPALSSSHQVLVWTCVYAAVALLCGTVALSSAGQNAPSPGMVSTSRPDWRMQALWMTLAACGSALLLSVTNHICQNIASVPFLWTIPLSLYLLTFILCFEGRAFYNRGLFLRLLGVALGGMAYSLSPSFLILPLKVTIPLFCTGLFISCMFLHGELARLKPDPAHMTSFYVMCALGGTAGAVFVALIAPYVFRGYYELWVALGWCAVLVLVVNHRDPESPFYRARWQPAWLLVVGLVVALIANLAMSAREQAAGARLSVRNFYGVLHVIDEQLSDDSVAKGSSVQASDGESWYRRLVNGTINHGIQFLAADRRRQPTSYYGPDSGIGVAIRSAGEHGSLRVGAIGLGTGTIAAYGRPGDHYTFYEINPLDVQIASQQFTFLRDSEAKIDIVLGDGRLSLEAEPPQGFDVLAVDAFTGDSIPVHLLTVEAFALYFGQLKPDGILAVHISNSYLNLQPVVESAAARLGKEAVVVTNPDDHPNGIFRSQWLLIGNSAGLFNQPEFESAVRSPMSVTPGALWTDDYSSLFKILR
jgi:hypothetical protein